MPNKLKDLKITSTDLVAQGANPDSFIKLFKRRDGNGVLQKITGIFKGGNSAEPQTPSESAAESNDDDGTINKNKSINLIQNQNQKEESDTMKIDKSKMTPEEQAVLEEFEKKFGIEENVLEQGAEVLKPFPPELHPEVKKALDEAAEVRKAQTAEIEALKKSLEIERLTATAKKYEIIGKKADELAPKLYEFKKAGGTMYDDYVALLDEQTAMAQKSGMFAELGRNTAGSADASEQIGKAAAEIKKSAVNDMDSPEAVIKAFEGNPELAAQYENEYRGGK